MLYVTIQGYATSLNVKLMTESILNQNIFRL
jgi:hypothetical protein